MQLLKHYLLIFTLKILIILSDSYILNCPTAAEWNFRATILCPNRNKYYCLLCPTTDKYECSRNVTGGGYVEGCGGPRKDRQGFKKVISGSFTREHCRIDRYQPIAFYTNENSDCIYEKSNCNEEGQIIFSNGTGKEDRLCSCNLERGYAFVNSLQKDEFCQPSEYEDCSCYVNLRDKHRSSSAGNNCTVISDVDRYIKNKTSNSTFVLKWLESSYYLPEKMQSGKRVIMFTCFVAINACLVLGLYVICEDPNKTQEKRSQFAKTPADGKNYSSKMRLQSETPADGKNHISKMRLQSDQFAQNIIRYWQKNDEMFVVTRAAQYVLYRIKTDSCVTVTGSYGVGKTATIRYVALQMRNEGYDILPIHDPYDVIRFYQPNKKTLCVIDDFCGKYLMSHTDVEKWKKQMDDIQLLLDETSTKLIIGCRLQVYLDQSLRCLKLFKTCVCNLQSKEFIMSDKERNYIAQMYLQENAKYILTYDRFPFFPLLCRLSAENKELDIPEFFEIPFTVYETELNLMNCVGAYGKLCVLALVVTFNNQLQEAWLADNIDREMRSVIKNTCEACKLNRGTSRIWLRDELDSLINTFLKKKDNVYSFIHDNLFDFMEFYFEKQTISFVNSNADKRFIRERVSFLTQKDKDNSSIAIPDMYLNKLYWQTVQRRDFW